MENKVLINVYVPYLDKGYDMYVPVNKRVHVVIELIKKSLFELSEGSFNIDNSYELYNFETGTVYNMNDLIRDTDIGNSSKVVII